MKKSKTTKILTAFIITFIVIICFSIYLIQDESLNPEATQWMTEASTFKENDAYYFLLGMSAPAADDPITAGKQAYNLYKDKPPLWYPNVESDDVKASKTLALPSHDGLFCSMREIDCLSYIFANVEKIPDAIQPYSVIKERYLRFIQSKDYHTNLISMGASANYNYLMKGNQIVLLQAIDQVKINAQSAIKDIQTDLADLRQQLKTADNLLFKLVINAMIVRDIQTITLLEHKYDISVPIARLDAEEKNLDKPFKYELVYQRNVMAHLGDDSSNDIENKGYFYRWINRLCLHFFYIPNMTTNQVFAHYKILQNLNSLDYSIIKEFVNAHKGEQSFTIKNLMGSTIANVHEYYLTYVSYCSRMIDTDLKIMLSNAINAQKSEGAIDLTQIQNPYFKNPTHPYWSTDGKQVCLDKPKFGTEDNSDNKVCLIVKL